MAVDSNIAHYKIEVRDPITGDLIRTEEPVRDKSYRYTYEKNVQDNGTPLRRFRLYVYPVNDFGELGEGESLLVDNPAPSLPALTITPGMASAKLTFDEPEPEAGDWQGLLIWESTSPTVDVSGPPSYILSANETTISGTPGIKRYIRYAYYDYFGKDPDELNISDEVELDFEALTGDYMDDALESAIQKGENAWGAINDPNGIADQIADLGEQTTQQQEILNEVGISSDSADENGSLWARHKAVADLVLDETNSASYASLVSGIEANYVDTNSDSITSWVSEVSGASADYRGMAEARHGIYVNANGLIGGFTLLAQQDPTDGSNLLAAAFDVDYFSVGTGGSEKLKPFRIVGDFIEMNADVHITGDVIVDDAIESKHIKVGTMTGEELSASVKIVVGTGTDIAVMDGQDDLYRFYAGDVIPALAPFRVDKYGAVKLTNMEAYDSNGNLWFNLRTGEVSDIFRNIILANANLTFQTLSTNLDNGETTDIRLIETSDIRSAVQFNMSNYGTRQVGAPAYQNPIPSSVTISVERAPSSGGTYSTLASQTFTRTFDPNDAEIGITKYYVKQTVVMIEGQPRTYESCDTVLRVEHLESGQGVNNDAPWYYRGTFPTGVCLLEITAETGPGFLTTGSQSGPGGIDWADITGKPSTFTPSAHTHAASEIVSGTFSTARIPTLPISKIDGLQAELDAAGETWNGGTVSQTITAPQFFLENDTGRFFNTGGFTYLQGKAGDGLRLCGFNGADLPSLEVRRNNNYYAIWDEGNFDPNTKMNAYASTVTGGYFKILPYNASYDDGSRFQSYYDGNERKLVVSCRDINNYNITATLDWNGHGDFGGYVRAAHGFVGTYDSGVSDWGSNIWSMGKGYGHGPAGSNHDPGYAYGIQWLRSNHAKARSEIGEGLYVFQAGSLQGGVGSKGIWAEFDIAAGRHLYSGADIISGRDFIINGTGRLLHSNNASREKISVWSSSIYGIGMDNSYTYGYLGNDYAMTFQMSNADSRGFWWGAMMHSNAQGAMSLTTDGKLYVDQMVDSPIFKQRSDRRLKRDIVDYGGDPLEFAESVRLREFNWKNSGAEEIGFIAQEIQSIDARYVSKNTDGILSLNSGAMTATALAAVGQLSIRERELEKRVEELEKRLAA